MTQKLELLQIGRLTGAAIVVVSHANAFTPIGFDDAMFWWVIPLFFTMSGYVMTYIHDRKVFAPRSYFVGRLCRVYLPYWPVGIGAALVYAWLGREVDWSASLLLLPGQTALIPAWTLQRELVFYLLFGLFALFRAPMTGGALWATAIILRALLPEPLSDAEIMILHPDSLWFVAGMVTARCYVLPTTKVGRFVNYLGDTSYALYLVHLPIMGAAWRIGVPFWGLIATSYLASLAYHHGWEVRCTDLTRRLAQRVERAGGRFNEPFAKEWKREGPERG